MFNCCCIFLQAVTLADISDSTGYYISDSMITSAANNTYSSGYMWPNQNKLSKQDWAQWHLGLHLAIQVDNLGCFQQPLG